VAPGYRDAAKRAKKPARRDCRDWGKDWGRHDDDDAWWEDRSLPAKIAMGFGFAILGAGFIVLLIFIVMWLWNWLMPEIFNLGRINFWKAAGLMLLSFILFKSWGSKNGGRKDRKRKKQLKRYMQDDPSGQDEEPEGPTRTVSDK
jgi:hypothetical protein